MVSFLNAHLEEFLFNLLVKRRLHDFRLHKRGDQYADVEQRTSRLYHDIFMRQRESNPMSSARQAIWLTTVLHALGSYLIFSWGSENRTL
ncbi:hypothetical protein T01_14478 [Trichinella spiralis]|uniref:Uncharacterized protein n=1 Tax=Trichinella spiralis TaxID=6334 RepID=A0A0V1AJN3_TRISP|nr:hypothetical protein T01_14478 [Trichinella spiralis]